ncbi:MAG: hypothetical protein KR126chlam3_00064 [Chlamydiae bacterium]|nr:hypothetical protein [Chlamydiota bacterium]
MSAVGEIIQHVATVRGQVERTEVAQSATYKWLMAEHNFEKRLPAYSEKEGGIHQIVCDHFKGHQCAVEIFPFSRHSGSKLYQVKDTKTDNILGLLKVFPEDRSYEFLDEVFSYDAYQKHSLRCPSILGVAKLVDETETNCVLVEEMIPGETLQQHMDKLFAEKLGSTDREAQLQRLDELFISFGKSFAAFHTTDHSPPAATDSYTQQHFLEIIYDALEQLKAANAEVDEYYGIDDKDQFMSAIREYVGQNRELMQAPAPRSYIHADCSFGNFVYGEDKEFHLLDSWWGAFAVDSKGEPRGTPFFDYMQVINRLWYLLKDEKLSNAEYQQLQSAFRKGYAEAKGTIPDEEMQNFYSFVDAMLLLGGVTKWFHHGAKDSLGHLGQYWVGWLNGSLLQETKDIAKAV